MMRPNTAQLQGTLLVGLQRVVLVVVVVVEGVWANRQQTTKGTKYVLEIIVLEDLHWFMSAVDFAFGRL